MSHNQNCQICNKPKGLSFFCCKCKTPPSVRMILSDLAEREQFRLVEDPNYPKTIYTKGKPFDADSNYFWCHGDDSKLHLIHKRAEVKYRSAT